VPNKKRQSHIDELLNALERMIDTRLGQRLSQDPKLFEFEDSLTVKEDEIEQALDMKESSLKMMTKRLNSSLVFVATFIILFSLGLWFAGWTLTTYLIALTSMSIVFASYPLIVASMLAGPRQELLGQWSRLTRLKVRMTDLETRDWISKLE
jgi:hypothetical protein